eukprot:COSAG06_NODE_4657_length_4061_cov_1.164816_2_plen_145_part_00
METDAAAAAAASGGADGSAASVFDVDAYIGAYEGDTKLKRLEFIAKKVSAATPPPVATGSLPPSAPPPSFPRRPALRLPVCRLQAAELGNTETELQACRQLHNLAKQGTNTNIYRTVCAQVRVPRASHPCPHARSARSRRPRIG